MKNKNMHDSNLSHLHDNSQRETDSNIFENKNILQLALD